MPYVCHSELYHWIFKWSLFYFINFLAIGKLVSKAYLDHVPKREVRLAHKIVWIEHETQAYSINAGVI